MVIDSLTKIDVVFKDLEQKVHDLEFQQKELIRTLDNIIKPLFRIKDAIDSIIDDLNVI